MELNGKKALVTGSSRGIGRDMALALARAGADVAVHYISNRASAEAVQREIADMGRQCVLVNADLGGRNCAETIWKELAAEDFADIDILVLNASTQIRMDWEDILLEDFDLQMHTNVYASIRLMQKAVPHMKRKGWGRIVTVGSIHEGRPNATLLVYGASKTAQTTAVFALANALAKDGITVNNIAPGVILTDRNRAALAKEENRARVMARIPSAAFGSPEDCAGALLLFCSDAGRYITGQSLYVDGGMMRSL